MEQAVIDANVLVKLFINENYSNDALRLKDAYLAGRLAISVPSLTLYELINVLKYKGFSSDEIKRALRAVDDYAFRVEAASPQISDLIADIAIRFDITSYDASYLALASLLGAILYTADARLIKKVASLRFVRHIKNFD